MIHNSKTIILIHVLCLQLEPYDFDVIQEEETECLEQPEALEFGSRGFLAHTSII